MSTSGPLIADAYIKGLEGINFEKAYQARIKDTEAPPGDNEVGWGDNLHPTKLTPDEQYTHITLWCLLSAPLLIGCDISKLDDFTLNLLTNDEVLAINQDAFGKQTKQIKKTNTYQLWMKELQDGCKAIGIFNLSESYQTVSVKWNELNLPANENVRYLWRQKGLGNFATMFATKVAPHGVTLIKIK